MGLTLSAQDQKHRIPCESRLDSLDNYTLKEVGSEYNRLSLLKNSKCDNWGSDFQEIMAYLGTRLTKGKYSTTDLTAIMGSPFKKDIKTENMEIWIYYWRMRDELRFTVKNQIIISSKWWYPYE